MDIGEPERSGRLRTADDRAAWWLPLSSELDHTPVMPVARAGTPDVGRPNPRPGTVRQAVVRPDTRPGTQAVVRRVRAVVRGDVQAVMRRDVFPVQRTRDPLVDTDAMGLRNFNIGLVPASVTPPVTWQRAAWFAVLSSAAVLIGLAFAASKLVGTNAPDEELGMPGYPTTAPILTGFATSPVPSHRQDAVVGRPDGTPVQRSEAVLSTAHLLPGPPQPAALAPEVGTTPDAPPPPTVTTVPNSARPVVDGAALAAMTEWFYEDAAFDPATALELVADPFRVDVEALLAKRFAEVALIRVTEISVDPANGVTVSTLHVTMKDGTTTTEKRELFFTTTDDPLITAERPVGDA
ncbi:hypothetical protein ACQPZF_38555 [Actinosynnema sp. CS-041913]|uniref:hypothetical protein n=1 Tax=Actinosynnema sp. CS-041913 TaxID=3239917 RepID=UPI003D8BE28B